jgi:hypothetical protein
LRFFSLLDFRYYVLAIFLGLITVLVLYLSFGRTPSEEEDDRSDLIEFPDGLSSAKHPIPPILLFVYIGFVIWAIIYVIFLGILGEPI